MHKVPDLRLGRGFLIFPLMCYLKKFQIFYYNFLAKTLTTNSQIKRCCIRSRCLMVSTNQADPSCFNFRIAWILMEGRWFYFFRPLHLMQGLRSLEHWLLQKISMTILDQKFRFLIKKQVFLYSNISRTWIFWPLKMKLKNFMTPKNFNFQKTFYRKNYSCSND